MTDITKTVYSEPVEYQDEGKPVTCDVCFALVSGTHIAMHILWHTSSVNPEAHQKIVYNKAGTALARMKKRAGRA